MKKIALFDIDGTILSSQGAGRRAMESAFVDLVGATGPSSYRYDGKTDRQIVRELLVALGHDAATLRAQVDRIMAAYLARLPEVISARDVALFDGIREFVEAVDAADDLVLGLLTGNVVEGAMLKLQAAGLDTSRFVVGAFGSDHENRPELPPVARERARAFLGHDVEFADLVIIGDTPLDIACAHVNGAKAIAVATGHYSVDELAAHAPSSVFANFADTAAAMHAVRTA